MMQKSCKKKVQINTIIHHYLWILLFIFSQALAEEPKKPNYSNEQLLSEMLVVDVSERVLQKLPAIAITFSQDLATDEAHGKFITLTRNGKLVAGQENNWILADNPRRLYFTAIEPDTQYRVQLRPGLAAANGLALQKPADFEVSTRSIKPVFDFASKGSILPSKLTAGLPIRLVNVSEVDFEFLRVEPNKVQAILQKISLQGNLSTWDLNEINALTESVYSTRYSTDVRKNANEIRVLPIENIPYLQKPGLYFAIMRRPGQFSNDAYRATYFVVSNIGLHARLYKNKLEVFANRLDKGTSLTGLPLRLQGKDQSLEATTDRNGMASFVALPTKPLLLTAQQENQFALIDLREPTLDLSEYAVNGHIDQPFKPFIYASRDLYRPGEAVDLSIILRDRDGIPVGIDTLQLRIIRPDTKVLLEESIHAFNADLGYFQQRITIPNDAPTGVWQAEVRLDPKAKQPLNRFAFNIETFLPERMNLSLSTSDRPLMLKEKLVVAVQGDYLYGSPANKNAVSARYSTYLQPHPLADYSDFYFGNPADKAQLPSAALPELRLNEKGGGFLEVPAIANINSPITIQVLASLYETGGRTVNRRLTQSYWPAPVLVGIRPLFQAGRTRENEDAQFEIIRVDTQGKRVAAENVAVTLVKVDNEYFWEYSNNDGWQQRKNVNEYPLQQKKIQITAEQSASFAFPVAHGEYRLEVEDTSTGMKAAYAFQAGWGEKQQGARPDQVQMTLDKPAYQVGDMVKITITPPAAGEAILAVEGDDLLWSKRVNLPNEPTTIAVKLDKSWARHDLYFSAIVFRPASSQAKIAPNRALGIIHLPLDRGDRRADLTITAPSETQPEKPVKVQVSAPSLAGQGALLTLSAVDVGVLNITRFATPDPLNYYFAQHRYTVDQYDVYDKVIEFMDGSPLRQRFGGGLSESKGRQSKESLQITALFSGAVKFDETGNAAVTLQVPGFDGTLRLTALALGEKQFGVATKEMVVASPVVASMAGPRFLATGDSSHITVELHNTNTEEQRVSLAIQANEAVQLAYSGRDYVLAKGERKTINVPLSAGIKPDTVRIGLRLTGKDFVANRHLSLVIRPAYPMQSRIRSYNITPQDGEVTLDRSIVQALIPESLQSRLSMSNVPSLSVRNALDGLLNYPYACLEQTVSRVYPYLFLENDLAAALSLPPLDMQERNQQVQAALMRLSGMQLANGGFTLWGSYGSVEYWLTPYVSDFLLDAQQQSFKVPNHLLTQALDYLEKQLNEGYRNVNSRFAYTDQPSHLDFAARAYAAYVLSRQNRASLGNLRALYDRDAKQAASGLPLVHLGLALLNRGDKRRGNEALEKALSLVRDPQKYYGDYGSEIRDEALSLALLLDHDYPIPTLDDRMKTLSDYIYRRQYLSTQEQMAIFRLSRALHRQGQQAWRAQLQINSLTLDLNQTGSYQHTVQLADFEQGIKVDNTGDERLYVSVEVQGYPKVAPVVRKDLVDIQRTWYDLAGNPISAEQIPAGELLLTRLQLMASEDMHDALVVDLLPAAFELENTNISETADLSGIVLQDLDKRVVDLWDIGAVQYEAFRDDRYLAAITLQKKTTYQLFYLVRVVSTGRFAVPPSWVQDMYRPDYFGVGAAPAMMHVGRR